MQLDEATDPWGIKVSKVEVFTTYPLFDICLFAHFNPRKVKDVRLPHELQRAMAAEAEAAREARAKVSKSLNHSLIQLKMASVCHVLQ